MLRRFFSLIIVSALVITAASMACAPNLETLDNEDETDSGT